MPHDELRYDVGESFSFQRFQSPISNRKELQSVRSDSSFKWFEGKDGRKGQVSSTRLGGDYVLAESEQIAVDCRTDGVLRVYLSGKEQLRWSSKNCQECHITKFKKKNNHPSHLGCIREPVTKPHKLNFWSGRSNDGTDEKGKIRKHKSNKNASRDDSYFYLQDLLLKSQRIIRRQTGPMRYQQIIEIDKIGLHDCTILVRLLKKKKNSKREDNDRLEEHEYLNSAVTTTVKKPFESLEVYIRLEQMGSDVKIYTAGVLEVNRRVVPKIIIFDTSGLAGSLAGKGTLWLWGYFEKASINRNQQTTVQ